MMEQKYRRGFTVKILPKRVIQIGELQNKYIGQNGVILVSSLENKYLSRFEEKSDIFYKILVLSSNYFSNYDVCDMCIYNENDLKLICSNSIRGKEIIADFYKIQT